MNCAQNERRVEAVERLFRDFGNAMAEFDQLD